MSSLLNDINEWKASEAFSRQAPVFDRIYRHDPIIEFKRRQVRDHLLRHLKPSSNILELNCGTGEDALFLAQHGHSVHATDISAAMLEQLKMKLNHGSPQQISFEQCSFTNLQFLENRGPYDCIFSNFGGLNCTEDLYKVLASFSDLLKPKGTVTLVLISNFCLWEFLLLFRGKWKTACRRFFSRGGRTAHIEGTRFKCWYYPPSTIIRRLQGRLDLVALEGLCTLVPPSYISQFADHYPRLFSLLCRKEQQLKANWPWRWIGDYFIITLEKR